MLNIFTIDAKLVHVWKKLIKRHQDKIKIHDGRNVLEGYDLCCGGAVRAWLRDLGWGGKSLNIAQMGLGQISWVFLFRVFVKNNNKCRKIKYSQGGMHEYVGNSISFFSEHWREKLWIKSFKKFGEMDEKYCNFFSGFPGTSIGTFTVWKFSCTGIQLRRMELITENCDELKMWRVEGFLKKKYQSIKKHGTKQHYAPLGPLFLSGVRWGDSRRICGGEENYRNPYPRTRPSESFLLTPQGLLATGSVKGSENTATKVGSHYFRARWWGVLIPPPKKKID